MVLRSLSVGARVDPRTLPPAGERTARSGALQWLVKLGSSEAPFPCSLNEKNYRRLLRRLDATPGALEVVFQASLQAAPGPLGLGLAVAGFRLSTTAAGGACADGGVVALSVSPARDTASGAVAVRFPAFEASFSIDCRSLEGTALRLKVEGAPGEMPVRFAEGEVARALAAVVGTAPATVVVRGVLSSGSSPDGLEVRDATIASTLPARELHPAAPDADERAGLTVAVESAPAQPPAPAASTVAGAPAAACAGGVEDSGRQGTPSPLAEKASEPAAAQSTSLPGDSPGADGPSRRTRRRGPTSRTLTPASQPPARPKPAANPSRAPRRAATTPREDARPALPALRDGESPATCDFESAIRQIIRHEIEQRTGEFLAQLDEMASRLRDASEPVG